MSVQETHRYDDIIDLPHPRSTRHPPMSMRQRAAQFLPFAALNGYEELLERTARRSEPRIVLASDAREELDRTLATLLERLAAGGEPCATVTWFRARNGTDGGVYETVRGRIVRHDEGHGTLVTDGGAVVPCADVMMLELEE